MGYVFMSTTAHPTYGGYRDRSPFWLVLPTSQRERPGGKAAMFSHIWVGAARSDGHIDRERLQLLRERVHIAGLLSGGVQVV